MRRSASHTRRWNTVPRMSTGTRERLPSPAMNARILVSISGSASSTSSAALNSSASSRFSFGTSLPSLTAHTPCSVLPTSTVPSAVEKLE